MYYAFDKYKWYTGSYYEEPADQESTEEVPPILTITTNVGELRAFWDGNAWATIPYQDFSNPERITQQDIDAGANLPIGNIKPNAYLT